MVKGRLIAHGINAGMWMRECDSSAIDQESEKMRETYFPHIACFTFHFDLKPEEMTQNEYNEFLKTMFRMHKPKGR